MVSDEQRKKKRRRRRRGERVVDFDLVEEVGIEVESGPKTEYRIRETF